MDDKLRQIFAEALKIPLEKVTEDLNYRSIPEWDSVAHMTLVAALDEGFDIMLETEDVIDMSSFSKAREIIRKYVRED